MEDKKILEFPKGFLWGTSTSAYQVEGGNINDWSEWEKSSSRIAQLKKEEKNIEDHVSGQAVDSYNRYEEDFDLAVGLNNNAHRLSIEWSRVEPEEGKFNAEEIEHYRKVIKALRARKIEPFVTLWHYTVPVWFSEAGGWLSPKAEKYFLRFVEKIVSALKDDVNFWITFNEPETVVRSGYLLGNRPPHKKGILKGFRVLKTLVEVHKSAYGLIHEIAGGNAKVGFSESLVFFESYDQWPHNLFLKFVFNFWRNELFVPKVVSYSDFIGIQYYFHSRIRLNPFVSWRGFQYNENKDGLTDMGWEIYPEGIYHILKSLKKYNLPVYITENGLADEKDNRRAKFIIEHLKYVHKAIQEGVNIKGYFYWSLLDNFEWEQGFGPKFGLYAVNRKTFERTARSSAKIYAEICKNNNLKF